MKRGIWLRWTWIVVAAALACIPAWGQADSCSTDITCWSSIDIDTYGDIAGVSVTEEPYYYYWGGLAAYVEGMLLGDSGYTLIEDVEAEDDGEGYAEADTSGTASDTGDYVQDGFNWIIYLYEDLDPEYLGETQEDEDWIGPCFVPSAESTSVASPAWGSPAPFESTVAQFAATVSDPYMTVFSGSYAREEDAGGDYDSCYAQYHATSGPATVPETYFTIGSGGLNTYLDSNGWPNGYWPSGTVNAYRQYAVLPCGYTVYQTMEIECPSGSYYSWITNQITEVLNYSSLQVCRGAYTNPYPACDEQ